MKSNNLLYGVRDPGVAGTFKGSAGFFLHLYRGLKASEQYHSYLSRMSLLQVINIEKKQQGQSFLQDISFVQHAFQHIGIIGETGSGKSTLMKIIGGLVQPDSGAVLFKEEKVAGPDDQLIPGHKGIAYLSQFFELRNHYRMEELLSYANILPQETAVELYRICRIDHLLKRKTDSLSGGEKQRIALARLLVTAPQLLLLDEPFSNLDLIHKNILKTVIHELAEKLGITCALVSHDPLDILSWADHILVMKNGRIIQQGTPQQVYHQPVDEYVAGLLGSYNLIGPAQGRELFAHLPAVKLNDKHLFIRPEGFRIKPAEDHLVSGRVEQTSFLGSYYEVKVSLADVKLTIKTDSNDFHKGQAVSLAVAPEAIWYI